MSLRTLAHSSSVCLMIIEHKYTKIKTYPYPCIVMLLSLIDWAETVCPPLHVDKEAVAQDRRPFVMLDQGNNKVNNAYFMFGVHSCVKNCKNP